MPKSSAIINTIFGFCICAFVDKANKRRINVSMCGVLFMVHLEWIYDLVIHANILLIYEYGFNRCKKIERFLSCLKRTSGIRRIIKYYPSDLFKNTNLPSNTSN